MTWRMPKSTLHNKPMSPSSMVGRWMFNVGQSHKANSSNRSLHRLLLLLSSWWVEIYCTLKTNWKNNLTDNDSNKYHRRESCMWWWARWSLFWDDVYRGEAESLLQSLCWGSTVLQGAFQTAALHLREPICILWSKHPPLWLCFSGILAKSSCLFSSCGSSSSSWQKSLFP